MKKYFTLNSLIWGIVALVAASFVGVTYVNAETSDWRKEAGNLEWTPKKIKEWNAILSQFIQKSDADTATSDVGGTGNLIANTTGKGLVIATNTQATARLGQVTLVAGEKYLTNNTVTAKTHIFISPLTTSSVARVYATYQTNGGGRVLFQAYTNAVGGAAALAAGDVSVVNYQFIEATP